MALWTRDAIESCSTIYPIHQNLFLWGHFLCVLLMPYYCGWDTFALSPVIYSSSLCLLQAEFGSLLLMGQSYVALGFSWVQLGVFQGCRSTELQAPSLCYPLGSFVDEWSLQSDPCLLQANWWSLNWTGICGYLLHFLRQKSLWNGAGS